MDTAVVVSFHVGGVFRFQPYRYENQTVVQWRCGAKLLSYPYLIWLLDRIKVNNVGQILFNKNRDKDAWNMEIDLVVIQDDISLAMFVQLATNEGTVDLYVDHDLKQPLFIPNEPRISACVLFSGPCEFSEDTAEVIGGSDNFNIEVGVESFMFPKDINEDAPPFSPFYTCTYSEDNIQRVVVEFCEGDSGEEEEEDRSAPPGIEGVRLERVDSEEEDRSAPPGFEGVRLERVDSEEEDRSAPPGFEGVRLGRVDSEEEDRSAPPGFEGVRLGRVSDDEAEETEDDDDSEDREYEEANLGVEGGLGRWVDVENLSEDEEYRDLRRRNKKKKSSNEQQTPAAGTVGTSGTRNVDEDQGCNDEISELGDDSDVSYISPSDFDGHESRRRRKTGKSYRPTKSYRETPYFEEGMIFLTANQFKDAVIEHSLRVHREIAFLKNDKCRIRFKCANESCPWKAYCMKPKYKGHWQMRGWVAEHTCPRLFTSTRLDYKIIGKHFIKERKSTAVAMKQKDIKKYAKEELGFEITQNQARRARNMIKRHFAGDYEKEFKRIWDYVVELKTSNPGSTVILDAPDCVFSRMYVCLDAVKRGFVSGCRKVLGIDGCFLKGPYKQQLLSVVGRDANDQMFPLAWAVVEIENHANWVWFLQAVMRDANIQEDGKGWAFLSDQHPSILHAVRLLMPEAEHRRCARHIFSKWRRGHEGEFYSTIFWTIVRSSCEPHMKESVEQLYTYDKEAWNAMLTVQPKYWFRNYQQPHCKSDVVDNNMCETFNAFIWSARNMSIVSLFEEIRRLVMKRFVTRRAFGNHVFVGKYGPRIWAKIEDNSAASLICHAHTNGSGGWEVVQGLNKYIVMFDEKTCGCRSWDLTGIPCCHAVSVITALGEHVENYVSHWYSKEMFMKSYEPSIQPVKDERFRLRTDHPDISPPPKKAVLGRRRVNRIPEHWEPKNRKKTPAAKSRSTRCTSCFRTGHKSKNCKRKHNGVVDGESSQSASNAARVVDVVSSQIEILRNQYDARMRDRATDFPGLNAFMDPVTGLTASRERGHTVSDIQRGRGRLGLRGRLHFSGSTSMGRGSSGSGRGMAAPRPTQWFGGFLGDRQPSQDEEIDPLFPTQNNVHQPTSTPVTEVNHVAGIDVQQVGSDRVTLQDPQIGLETAPTHSIPPSSTQSESIKRKRGRPLGSKNKK